MDTEESTSAETINLQIFVPDYNIQVSRVSQCSCADVLSSDLNWMDFALQKCLQVNVDDAVFVVKQTILNSLPKVSQLDRAARRLLFVATSPQ